MGQIAPGATQSRPAGRTLHFPLSALGNRFSSLRVRLLALVLLAMTPALALMLYFAWDARQDARDQAQQDALTLTQLSVIQQQQVIEGSRQLMVSLSLLSASSDLTAVDPVSCQSALATMLTDLNFYANFGIAGPDGKVICSAAGDATATYDIASRVSVQTAVQQHEFGVGGYVDDPISGKQVLDMTYPISGPDGALKGVLFLDLDLAWLNSVGEKADLPNGATFSILDRSGTIIARYPDSGGFVGRPYPEGKLRDFATTATGKNGVAEANGIDGESRLYGFTRIMEPVPTGLSALVGIPTSTAYASVNRDIARNLIALGIVALLVMAAAWFGGDLFVIRQTRRLITATNAVAGGDLSARSGFTGTSGEIGALAHSFDVMAESLEKRAAEKDRAEAELRALNESLEERIAERTAEVERHAEELRRSNSELEDFTYVVSHDLKEPLRGIEAFSAFLAEDYGGQLDDEGRRYVAVVRESAVRMKELIENLLELSRVGRQTGAVERVRIGEIVAGAVEELRYAIAEKHADVRPASDFPEVVCGPVRIKEVFKNLISNAIKFNDRPKPLVEVSWKPEGDFYRFEVRDDGIGIDPAYHDKVFQIFQRLERREDYPGSGAGLTICKKTVEMHGGRIGVESVAGEGSTFWFTLPANTSTSAEGAKA